MEHGHRQHHQLTGAVTINGVFSKHVQLPILGDDAAAAIVASRVHCCLGLQFDHLLGFVGFGLPATFSYRGNGTSASALALIHDIYDI